MATGSGFRFLYREDRGRIARAAWWRAATPLAGLVAIATAGWRAISPYAVHDLATQPFIDGATIAAYVYLALYAFGLILAAVCWYNVSAKRFRDRGRPGRLAAALPLAAFLAGALAWFAPRSFGSVPAGGTTAALAAVALVALWTVIDLGFGPTAVQSTRIGP